MKILQKISVSLCCLMLFVVSAQGQEYVQRDTVLLIKSYDNRDGYQLTSFYDVETYKNIFDELQRTLSLHVEKEPIKKVLQQIALQCNLGIVINADQPEMNREISLALEDGSVAEALALTLANTGYKAAISRRREIVLNKVPDPVPQPEQTEEIQQGTLQGRVVDASTGEPLIGANVILENTTIGTSTDTEGEFVLMQLPAGEQRLNIRYLGYIPAVIDVMIVSGEVVEQTIRLQPQAVEGEEVIIHTQALGQARAIRQQLGSNTIVNVVSESRLRELPDANAAESVGRLPGISLIRDAGEGQMVAIRGIGPQYSSITVDGNRVPATDIDSRAVDLSMISPEMLTGIEVYKSLRPDMYADAIGGTVNFQMGGAPSESMYRLRIESGYSSHINDIGTYKGTFIANNRFFDERLGAMVSLNAQRVDRSSHELGADYEVVRDARPGEDHAPVRVVSLGITDRHETRDRFGGNLALDFKLDNGRLLFSNAYSRQNRNEARFQNIYHRLENHKDWLVYDTDRHISTYSNSLAGEHDMQTARVNWRVSRSVSTNQTPLSTRAIFRERSAFDVQGVDLSQGPDVLVDAYRDRPESAAMFHPRTDEIGATQKNWSGSLDIRIPVVLGQIASGYVKVGGKHYAKFRDRVSDRFYWQGWEGTKTDPERPWSLTESGFVSLDWFVTDPEPYSILDDQYEISWMPNRERARFLWDEYSRFYERRPYVRFEDYQATERLSAAYIMTELNVGPNVMLLPGVRYELDHSDYTAKIGSVQGKMDEIEEDFFATLDDTTAVRSIAQWYPMVQLRYRPFEWFDIRLARTESASRPDFHSISPRRRIGHHGGTVRRGDPELRPAHARNYDLFFTFNHNRMGMLSFGAFYKEIDDLIYIRNAVVFNPEENNLPVSVTGFRITEPVNNPNLTTVHGFEAEWQSNLINLPPPFNGLVINANYSRFFSRTQYPSFEIQRTSEGLVGVDTFRVAPMVHQSDQIANVSIGYDYRGFSGRVSMQYQGATLNAIGSRPETDHFTDDYLRFDATIRQRILDSLRLFINLHNLTNREDRSSQFTYDRPRAIEYYGASFDIGIEYRL